MATHMTPFPRSSLLKGGKLPVRLRSTLALWHSSRMPISVCVLKRSRPSNELAAHARLLGLIRGPAAENFWTGGENYRRDGACRLPPCSLAVNSGLHDSKGGKVAAKGSLRRCRVTLLKMYLPTGMLGSSQSGKCSARKAFYRCTRRVLIEAAYSVSALPRLRASSA
jgi:hypothetical protein